MVERLLQNPITASIMEKEKAHNLYDDALANYGQESSRDTFNFTCQQVPVLILCTQLRSWKLNLMEH